MLVVVVVELVVVVDGFVVVVGGSTVVGGVSVTFHEAIESVARHLGSDPTRGAGEVRATPFACTHA